MTPNRLDTEATERRRAVDQLHAELSSVNLLPLEQGLPNEVPVRELRRGSKRRDEDNVGLATLVEVDGVWLWEQGIVTRAAAGLAVGVTSPAHAVLAVTFTVVVHNGPDTGDVFMRTCVDNASCDTNSATGQLDLNGFTLGGVTFGSTVATSSSPTGRTTRPTRRRAGTRRSPRRRLRCGRSPPRPPRPTRWAAP